MLGISPRFGARQYTIIDGAAQIVSVTHLFRPEPGETDAGFMGRILADIPPGPHACAEMRITYRDGRIANAEIVITPGPGNRPAP